MRIIVDVPDLQPGRAASTYVASYVRAALKLHALRRELAQAVLDVVRCSKALASRREASTLLAEAQELLKELDVVADARCAVLDRSRPPIHGGQGPVASPASIRTRLLGLIDCGALPAVMPRRMFIGPCRETHPCTACPMDIRTGAQEFEWTNPGNLIVFFHRRCADSYLTLNDGQEGG